ncbi:retrotransposon protein, putative, ty1-copia subclass [Tanacetum coccineum]
MASLEAAKWNEAMKSKIQSMYDNQVWNLVDITPSIKTVGCKWIFKKKTNMDGKVYTYKARLVANGYTQTHKIDYEETFSPVAKIKSIKIMLAIAAFHDYEIWLMDVKTAFLNRKLTEEVFMAQPEGFENEKYPKRVYKLQKAIYGLKQDSRKLDRCSRVPYASVVGSIKYAMTCTRPDVSFALSMFMVDGEEELRVTGYYDASWQTDKDDCHSQFACEASKEAIWMKNFIGDLGDVPTVQDPIEIFCDNESAVALTKEPKDHRKLEEEYHSIKDDTPLVSVYTTGNVTVRGMLIPDGLLTDVIRVESTQETNRTPRATRTPNPADVVQKKKGKQSVGETSLPKPSLKERIRQQKPSTTIPSPSDDKEHDEIHEATQLSLALHKTSEAAKEQENVATVEKKILEEDVEKIIEG